MLGKLGVLVSIAIRNLFTSWLNLVIGLLILAGTVLVVVGGALLDSVDHAMSGSVIGSVAGDLQIYSKESKGELELFGSFGGDDSDLAPIPDFSRIEPVIRAVPNVREVVPMGIKGSMLVSGNTIDLILARLRAAVRDLGEKPTAEGRERVESLKTHVRHIVEILAADQKNLAALLTSRATEERDAEAIARASASPFWDEFDRDPYGSLEFLENRIAPQLADGDLIYIRYIGTDPDRFMRTFDRMRLIEGTPIPAGHRGFLFSKRAYEDNFKLKTAWRLDRIKEQLETNKRTLAKDAELKRWVRENQAQTREIALQLDPRRTQVAVERLQKALGSNEKELEPLLQELFAVTDANFGERYAIFYRELARDLLDLYRVRIGDNLTLSAFSRAGYMQSVNVKVYGVFQFDGLEKSPLGGFTNLMDLVTFRELYGHLSPERIEELRKLKAATGAKEVDRESAEEDLFGESKQLTRDVEAASIDETELLAGMDESRRERRGEIERTFPAEELSRGVVLNAAILLKDPSKLDASLQAVQAAADAAGLGLRVITWHKASGMIGQFVRLARFGLYLFVFIIFVVTLVVINNAMMMATLQRVREIGTLRAIGAQRRFVLALICVETLVLGIVFGGAGLLSGSGIMALLHRIGIGAASDELYFFFSGPRLYPTVSAGNLGVAFGIVILVSLISTLYPAVIATRVAPVTAMQSDE